MTKMKACCVRTHGRIVRGKADLGRQARLLSRAIDARPEGAHEKQRERVAKAKAEVHEAEERHAAHSATHQED